MPRAVDMRVMPVRRLVLDMRRVDRDPERLLLRRLVDLRVIRERRPARLRKNLRDRSRQRRLAMIKLANRPYVAVRLRPLQIRFAHSSEELRVETECASTCIYMWSPFTHK